MRTNQPGRLHLLAGVSALALAALVPRAGAADANVKAQRFIEELRAETGAPSISVAVARDGKIIFTGATGFADLGHQVAATADTVYNIGSVSKVITAVAVMQLVESGSVDLEDPIQELVPEFSGKGARITLRHLLTHTSGIRHYRPYDFREGTRWDNVGSFDSFAEAITIFKDDPLLFEPGEHYFYTSYGTNLLQGVIEHATGQSFEDYLSQHVWRPAGMTDTYLHYPERVVPHHASGYSIDEGVASHYYPQENFTYKFASGGMLSTAGDLVRFVLAILDGRLLKPSTVDLMLAPQLDPVFRFEADGSPTKMTFQQALMWRIRQDEEGRDYAHHCGTIGGFNSCLAIYRDERLIVATVDNGELIGLEPGRRLADIFRRSHDCANTSVPSTEVVQGEVGEELDRFLLEMTERGFSGAVLVSRQGEILLKKGYGMADREGFIPNTSETRFNVASVAKTFTAAAILDLEEDGLLRIDDSIEDFLGSFPKAKSSATIHHLLTHTAGLAVRGTTLQYDSLGAFVESMKRAEIESTPGERFRYTNAGYTLLAALVETISHKTFDAVLQERLFAPACMRQSAYVWELDPRVVPLAVGYRGEKIEDLQSSPREEDAWGNRGPGGIATTVGDLYRWIRALEADLVLEPESKARMFTPHVGDEGYGWHVLETDRGRLVRRGGGLPGYESSLRWYLGEEVVIIFAINNHLGLRVPVAEGIESIVFGQSNLDSAQARVTSGSDDSLCGEVPGQFVQVNGVIAPTGR